MAISTKELFVDQSHGAPQATVAVGTVPGTIEGTLHVTGKFGRNQNGQMIITATVSGVTYSVLRFGANSIGRDPYRLKIDADQLQFTLDDNVGGTDSSFVLTAAFVGEGVV